MITCLPVWKKIGTGLNIKKQGKLKMKPSISILRMIYRRHSVLYKYNVIALKQAWFSHDNVSNRYVIKEGRKHYWLWNVFAWEMFFNNKIKFSTEEQIFISFTNYQAYHFFFGKEIRNQKRIYTFTKADIYCCNVE